MDLFFSFKKVDRRNAIIYVLTKTLPTQMGSRKVVRFMQNEPHLFCTELNGRMKILRFKQYNSTTSLNDENGNLISDPVITAYLFNTHFCNIHQSSINYS